MIVTIGDGKHKDYTIEHNLNTKHIVMQVYKAEAPYTKELLPMIDIMDANHVNLIFDHYVKYNELVVMIKSL